MKQKKVNKTGGKRAAQVAAGAYDGRFKTKVVVDKKKKEKKNWARKKQ